MFGISKLKVFIQINLKHVKNRINPFFWMKKSLEQDKTYYNKYTSDIVAILEKCKFADSLAAYLLINKLIQFFYRFTKQV